MSVCAHIGPSSSAIAGSKADVIARAKSVPCALWVLALALDYLAAQGDQLLRAAGRKLLKAIPVVSSVKPADAVLIEDVARPHAGDGEGRRLVKAAESKAGLMDAVKAYGTAARGAEAALHVL